MKVPQLLVLLITILVHAATAFPTEVRAVPGRDKYASWDDVNVVAHGMLQLGQALKENVDKTKVQMRDVNAKLRDLDGRVNEVEKKQQVQDEALKARGATVEEMERRAAELVQDVKNMNSRMDTLEEKVDEVPKLDSNYSDDSETPFIQRLLAAQNRRIDLLVEKIKQQQDKLEKHSLHLQTLQNKIKQKRVKSHRQREETRGEAEPRKDTADLPRDCHDLFLRGERVSGVYAIQPTNSRPFDVLCDITADGGWTVIQKRQDGSHDFNQLWGKYKTGFGSLNGEFWLGLENIRALSEQGPYVLQLELSSQSGEQQTERYRFRLDGEEKKFAIHLQDETSAVRQEDAGVPFSTADRDNDLSAEHNCAEQLSGGWWFSSCGESNLNGRYPSSPALDSRQTMFWGSIDDSLKSSVLKIAPDARKH